MAQRGWRSEIALAAAFVLLLMCLAGADATRLDDEVVACGPWDSAIFQDFGQCDTNAARLAGADSAIVLHGLGPRTDVMLSLALASALPQAQAVRAVANGVIVRRAELGGRPGVWDIGAHTDHHGAVRLELRPEQASTRASLRVGWLRISQQHARLPALRTWLWYAALLLFGVGFERWSSAGQRRGWFGLAVVGGGLLLALAGSRVTLAGQQPWLLKGLGAVCGMAALAGCWVSRRTAAVLALCFGARALLVLHPGFPGVDVGFHAHNVARYQRGLILRSQVSNPGGSGVLPIPYPPLLYALLSLAGASGETAVRVAMLLLEGTAPLLVWRLMRSGGAPQEACELAAVAASVMPEGLLVLAKGVAANILGAWLGLCVLTAVASAAGGWLIALLCALCFLSHPGAAASLAGLLVLWVLAGRARAPAGARILGLAALAAGLAFVLYYRDVAGLTLETLGTLAGQASAASPRFFQLRFVHLGKILQDLVLKFGALPLLLVPLGLRAAPPRLLPLLRAWLLGAAVLAGAAVLTPFALRFEYFVAPAVCMAAGLGAERLALTSRHRLLVGAGFGVAFLIQAVLGLLLASGRFDIINVVIPSSRWPLVAGG